MGDETFAVIKGEAEAFEEKLAASLEQAESPRDAAEVLAIVEEIGNRLAIYSSTKISQISLAIESRLPQDLNRSIYNWLFQFVEGSQRRIDQLILSQGEKEEIIDIRFLNPGFYKDLTLDKLPSFPREYLETDDQKGFVAWFDNLDPGEDHQEYRELIAACCRDIYLPELEKMAASLRPMGILISNILLTEGPFPAIAFTWKNAQVPVEA